MAPDLRDPSGLGRRCRTFGGRHLLVVRDKSLVGDTMEVEENSLSPWCQRNDVEPQWGQGSLSRWKDTPGLKEKHFNLMAISSWHEI